MLEEDKIVLTFPSHPDVCGGTVLTLPVSPVKEKGNTRNAFR